MLTNPSLALIFFDTGKNWSFYKYWKRLSKVTSCCTFRLCVYPNAITMTSPWQKPLHHHYIISTLPWHHQYTTMTSSVHHHDFISALPVHHKTPPWGESWNEGAEKVSRCNTMGWVGVVEGRGGGGGGNLLAKHNIPCRLLSEKCCDWAVRVSPRRSRGRFGSSHQGRFHPSEHLAGWLWCTHNRVQLNRTRFENRIQPPVLEINGRSAQSAGGTGSDCMTTDKIKHTYYISLRSYTCI